VALGGGEGIGKEKIFGLSLKQRSSHPRELELSRGRKGRCMGEVTEGN